MLKLKKEIKANERHYFNQFKIYSPIIPIVKTKMSKNINIM
jgi:hypothetical protein